MAPAFPSQTKEKGTNLNRCYCLSFSLLGGILSSPFSPAASLPQHPALSLGSRRALSLLLYAPRRGITPASGGGGSGGGREGKAEVRRTATRWMGRRGTNLRKGVEPSPSGLETKPTRAVYRWLRFFFCPQKSVLTAPVPPTCVTQSHVT